MTRVLFRVFHEAWRALRRPGRLARINRPAMRRLFRSPVPPAASEAAWQLQRHGGLRARIYADYGEYIRHQQSKLDLVDLSEYDARYPRVLRERLASHNLVAPGMTVLCLAARLGSEVKAFRALGCFAVGIDLNPGAANQYVLFGDFHDLQFPSASTDVVFTNSFDHVLDIERVSREVRRVLKSDGLMIVEAVRGAAEGVSPGYYESFFWSRIDDLVNLFERAGFVLVSRSPIEDPWPGEHLCFRKRAKDGDAATEST